MPLAAYAVVQPDGQTVRLRAVLGHPEPQAGGASAGLIGAELSAVVGTSEQAEALGQAVAAQLRGHGGQRILDELR